MPTYVGRPRSVFRFAPFLLLCGAQQAQAQFTPGSAWDTVAAILKSLPAPAAGYRRFNFPRRDLAVRVGEIPVTPGLALTGWVGFSGAPSDATAMGDLIVTASELGPVVRGLLERGIDISAIHNHLAGESPQVLYLHFHGHGAATALAARLDQVLGMTAVPRPVEPAAPPPLAIDTALVFGALGFHGRAAGSVASVSPVLVPSPVFVAADSLVRTLAAASPINIQQLSGGMAATSGDFAVLADRVQPLLRALAGAGITSTAVHSHLIGERPTITYIHFWGVAPLPDLVRGLRAALDAVR